MPAHFSELQLALIGLASLLYTTLHAYFQSRHRATASMALERNYSENPAWADIEPLPQDDGGLHPLAAIAYTDEYSEAMSYLRAVMAKNEFSERVLDLTDHIISMNPAHYTVWLVPRATPLHTSVHATHLNAQTDTSNPPRLYRAKTIRETKSSLQDEIAWLNPTALRHLKNYQIWHHRQTIIEQIGSPDGEPDFINTMLEQDSKNYHVWSYRQWLVKRFKLFDDPGELEWTEGMIEVDVRNNSAWNHRWFLVVGGRDGTALSEDVLKREMG